MVGDGPELDDAVQLARSLELSECVQFLGEQDRVVPLLSAADIFLLPSSQESFGLAALEAMACELPVVASNIGGLPEVVDDGVSGFLHAPEDLDGMAASAVGLLTEPGPPLTPGEIRERMSGNLCRCGAYVNIVKAIEAVLTP